MSPTEMKTPISKLVTSEQLLERLFPEDLRPSPSWLRKLRKNGVIPFVQVGWNIYFDEAKVRRILVRKKYLRP